MFSHFLAASSEIYKKNREIKSDQYNASAPPVPSQRHQYLAFWGVVSILNAVAYARVDGSDASVFLVLPVALVGLILVSVIYQSLLQRSKFPIRANSPIGTALLGTLVGITSYITSLYILLLFYGVFLPDHRSVLGLTSVLFFSFCLFVSTFVQLECFSKVIGKFESKPIYFIFAAIGLLLYANLERGLAYVAIATTAGGLVAVHTHSRKMIGSIYGVVNGIMGFEQGISFILKIIKHKSST